MRLCLASALGVVSRALALLRIGLESVESVLRVGGAHLRCGGVGRLGGAQLLRTNRGLGCVDVVEFAIFGLRRVCVSA